MRAFWTYLAKLAVQLAFYAAGHPDRVALLVAQVKAEQARAPKS